jgi:branched-chain amino acid transport system substrate-binding protein
MKRLLPLAVAIGLMGFALPPQWRSFERMGERRFKALNRPPKEIMVGVCWPFSVNRDGRRD